MCGGGGEGQLSLAAPGSVYMYNMYKMIKGRKNGRSCFPLPCRLALLQSIGRLDFGYWFFFFFALSNTCTSGWNTHYARVSGPQKALSARYAHVSGQCSTDDLTVRQNHWIDGRVSGPHLKILPALSGHIEHRVPALAGSVLMISPSGEITA